MAQKKPWGGRFREPLDASAEALSVSIQFDARLARVDIEGSRAHAQMLHERGLLSRRDLQAIRRGLKQIEQELEEGTFPLRAELEDIHMNIERRLTEICGDPGRRLHTGRSRNDQVATDLRLYLRGEIGAHVAALDELREALVEVAEREIDTVLPGYTHLQRAQPVRLAHHLLAYFEMFSRDRRRFEDARGRMDEECPLGSGALAGSSLPLDRASTARRLGFKRPSRNSLDAVASRDFALEFLSAAAIAVSHLSRLAEEVVLWSSAEFGFVVLPDAFSTGSSLMPQKKNPDVGELVRGKSGRVLGDLVSLFTVTKGLPLAYNRDLQEDKEPVFDATDTLRLCLPAMARMWRALVFDRSRMEAAIQLGYLNATDAAEYLVRKKIPFRKAHEIVGEIVARLTAQGRELHDLDASELQAMHPAFGKDALASLSPRGTIDARDLPGGPARRRVVAALRDARRRLERDRRRP